MEPIIEINRLSFRLNHKNSTDSELNSNKMYFQWDGKLPLVNSPIRIRLDNLQWSMESDKALPEFLIASVTTLVADPDWNLMSKARIKISAEWIQGIGKWGEAPFLRFDEVQLDKESQFLINEAPILLTPAINRILAKNDNFQSILLPAIRSIIRRISLQKFGSDVLDRLLKDLYFKVSPKADVDHLSVVITSSRIRDHFEQSESVFPYLYVALPTKDLLYYINHFTWPDQEVKGYKLSLSSIEVTGHNNLIIHLMEHGKDFNVIVDIGLMVAENIIYPKVNEIKAIGLNPLKRIIFNLLKSVLIRQIEGRSLDFDKAYRLFIQKLMIQFPLLTIQNNQPAKLDKLSIDPERAEILLHYPLG